MSNIYYHCMSSVKKFGGVVNDYKDIHNFFDETKELFADFRHRALRHHAQGIFECERKFGMIITNSDNKQVPVRLIAEQHIREDCGGFIPSAQDWLMNIQVQPWMNPGYRKYKKLIERGEI